ncbi:Pantetheine-phosphate adenylyltransferase [Elusimicrobium minutum Pei191]|uniref:Phosphopantetheine adenylyltransferase n=1 Tax=Elusimicrobium minutum (strain Pei191) TaxID=445932 RepID=B2KAX6_ELUMP|nr:pantetheine-phosphate adenylyltransferase [Elusimicrobium minutum]ACC97672.1 Pantetheine-phosphate adenylyltransferase [Elusimicrobium minutum Pei191]
MNKKLAIYPGTFDPVTNGHIDIVERSLDIFDEIIIAVLVNKNKKPVFSTEERVSLLKKATAHLNGVKVGSYDGLLVDYLRNNKCNVVLRGLRAATDLEYEFQLATTNNMMDPGIETVFLMTSNNYTFLTSSVIREAYSCGGELPKCVPDVVHKALKEKFSK